MLLALGGLTRVECSFLRADGSPSQQTVVPLPGCPDGLPLLPPPPPPLPPLLLLLQLFPGGLPSQPPATHQLCTLNPKPETPSAGLLLQPPAADQRRGGCRAGLQVPGARRDAAGGGRADRARGAGAAQGRSRSAGTGSALLHSCVGMCPSWMCGELSAKKTEKCCHACGCTHGCTTAPLALSSRGGHPTPRLCAQQGSPSLHAARVGISVPSWGAHLSRAVASLPPHVPVCAQTLGCAGRGCPHTRPCMQACGCRHWRMSRCSMTPTSSSRPTMGSRWAEALR